MDNKSAQWMGVTEAARAWGISTRRVRTLCESGLLRGAEKPGGCWRIPVGTPRPADGRASRKFDIAPDRVALFPDGMTPVVIAGGSFHSSRRSVRMREEDHALIDALLDRLFSC